MKTIEEQLRERNNNYTSIEEYFLEQEINFTEIANKKPIHTLSGSIIIPAYNFPDRLQLTLDALSRQKDIERLNIEVLVIDDCSNINLIEKVKIPKNLDTKFFRNEINFGSGISRDIGIYYSSNDNLIFLDSDIVPSEYCNLCNVSFS